MLTVHDNLHQSISHRRVEVLKCRNRKLDRARKLGFIQAPGVGRAIRMRLVEAPLRLVHRAWSLLPPFHIEGTLLEQRQEK